jgi:hypothetical protein
MDRGTLKRKATARDFLLGESGGDKTIFEKKKKFRKES